MKKKLTLMLLEFFLNCSRIKAYYVRLNGKSQIFVSSWFFSIQSTFVKRDLTHCEFIFVTFMDLLQNI